MYRKLIKLQFVVHIYNLTIIYIKHLYTTMISMRTSNLDVNVIRDDVTYEVSLHCPGERNHSCATAVLQSGLTLLESTSAIGNCCKTSIPLLHTYRCNYAIVTVNKPVSYYCTILVCIWLSIVSRTVSFRPYKHYWRLTSCGRQDCEYSKLLRS